MIAKSVNPNTPCMRFKKGFPMSMSIPSTFRWRGALALIVGILAIAWPGITILGLVFVFAVAAIGSAFVEAGRAFSGDGFGRSFGYVLLALVDIGAGVLAIAWPGITAFVLVLCIAAWAEVTGLFEVGFAFTAGETGSERALFALGGLLSMVFGVVLFVRPDIGALSVAEIFGLFSLAYGISNLVLAANV